MELKEIERSIITTYRKKIWVPFIKAINDYKLINENDKIAVCISGGKDSFLLAKCMQEIKKHGKINFDLELKTGHVKESRDLQHHSTSWNLTQRRTVLWNSSEAVPKEVVIASELGARVDVAHDIIQVSLNRPPCKYFSISRFATRDFVTPYIHKGIFVPP
mgnify:CR=1 FL=1